MLHADSPFGAAKIEEAPLSISTDVIRSGFAAARLSHDLSSPLEPDELQYIPHSPLSEPARFRWHSSSDGLSCPPYSDLAARLSITCISPSSASDSSVLSTPTFSFDLNLRPAMSDMEADVATKIEDTDDETESAGTISKMPSASPALTTPGNTPGPMSQSPAPSAAGAPAAGPVKRPRGRPRKHPLPSPDARAKLSMPRSKTGCVTCRRRKKKCDETKPQCLNCQKNAAVCEGYPERVVWKSGRQKAEEARQAFASTRPRELPALIDGVENETDRFFLDHFALRVSNVLTLHNDDKNPFREILLPMAIQHKGLMHALLCLSGSHLRPRNPEAFGERQNYHFDEACRVLRQDKKLDDQAHGRSTEMIDDPTVASTLVLLLNSICKGETGGQYRPHMDAAKTLVINQQSRGSAFGEFLVEFFCYHDTINGLTSLDRRPLQLTEDFQLPQFIVQPEAGALLGVLDGLFGYISKITRLRDAIRSRMKNRQEPVLDYQIVSDAVVVDAGIRTWVSAQNEGSPRFIAAQLYRQCTWIYLYRSIQPSRPSKKIGDAVDEGLSYMRQLSPDASTQSIMLMPLFLLGCAAFSPDQRPEIRRAFGTLKRYSSLGNIEPAREVVEKVWARMDVGDESSWDWETIINEMGYDILVS
ncbi:MAG: hypothetical protein M1832_005928 [Thelocarpon impressellum]|nr:MAG: hypothetical protein M1832_005928 [Thelocarpon impressellum]